MSTSYGYCEATHLKCLVQCRHTVNTKILTSADIDFDIVKPRYQALQCPAIKRLNHNANYRSSPAFRTEIVIPELFAGWIHISFTIIESLTPSTGPASGRHVRWIPSTASFRSESLGCPKCRNCRISVTWFSRLWKPVCMFGDSGSQPGLHTGWNHLGSFLKKVWWILGPEILMSWSGAGPGHWDAWKGPQMFIMCTTVEKCFPCQITSIIGK